MAFNQDGPTAQNESQQTAANQPDWAQLAVEQVTKALMPPELIEQLRRRSADPDTRTDAPPACGSSHFGGRFRTEVVHLDGSVPDPDQLPGPASADQIGSVEERLGFLLPEDLVQILAQVADGGFGPGGGLASLNEMADRYLQATTESPDPHERPWPQALFPICLDPPGLDCIDLESKRIVCWNEELSLERPGVEAWTESFQVVADDLHAWMKVWLESPPPREAREDAMNEGLLNGLRTSLEHWRSLTSEERAEFGLPEVGWEHELFGHLGVDLDDL